MHALIDTGALITGMDNLQVARFLLRTGLTSMDGVVFLDNRNRQMVLLRSNDGKPVRLADCGVAWDKRFTFYDQFHTTGTDIKQCMSAIAVQTLGKDMTVRLSHLPD